jgi:hypothetical protein
MICPSCGSEYREGFARCASCDVALVVAAPAPANDSEEQLVRIFATNNPALITVFKSLLDDAQIDYLAKGANIQDLFVGAIGAVQFFVNASDAEEARAIVTTLDQPSPPDDAMDAQ